MSVPSTSVTSRFHLLRPLGSGAGGQVYLAQDRERPGSPLALKLAGKTDQARDAARREFSRLARVDHPNVVRVFDFGRLDDDQLFLTTEWIDGPDLGTWCSNRGDRELGPVLAQLCRALHHLHSRGIIHGDLKPQNVLVQAGGQLKLVDFGLACSPAEGEHRGISGTAGFIAPEVLDGQTPSHRSDLFSLGVVLQHVLPKVSHLAVIGRELAVADPQARPSSAAMVIQAIGMVTGQDLTLTREELLGPYFPTAPFVGREALLDQLTPAPAGLFLVRGPEGIGRTSLLEELRIRLLVAGERCLLGRRSPTGGPLHALVPALGLDDTHPVDDEALDHLLDRVLSRCAETSATVLLDDVETDDEPGMRALRRMAHGSRTCVATVSDGAWSDRHEALLSHATLITVEGLALEEVEQMLCGMLPEQAHPLPVVHEVCSATGGNPQLVQELVRVAIESGRIDPVSASYSLDVGVASLEHLAHVRLEHVDQDARRELTRIAFFCHGAPAELAAERRDLLQRGLLVQDRGLTRLGNRWLRDALLAGLSPEERRAGHARTAAALAEMGAGCHLELAEQLALCGQGHRAAEKFAAAAAACASDLDPVASARLNRRAAELAKPGSDVWVRALSDLARLERTCGRFDSALAAHDKLLAHLGQEAPGQEAPREQQLEAAETLIGAGRYAEATTRLESALALARGPILARALLLLARVHLLQGDYATAEARVDLGLKTELPSGTLLGDLQHLMAICRSMQGQTREALVWLASALQTYQDHEQLHGAARVLNSRGMTFQREGDWATAADSYEQALELFTRVGDLRSQTLCTVNLGTVAQQRGEFSTALARYRRGLSMAHAMCSPVDQTRINLNMANLLLQLGDLDAAQQLLISVEGDARALGLGDLEAHALLFQAEVAYHREQWARGHGLARISASRFNEIGAPGGEAEAHLLLGRIAAAQHQWSETRQWTDRVPSDTLTPELRGHRCRLLGLAALEDGNEREATLQLEEALLWASRSGALDLAWRTHLSLLQLAQDSTDRDFHATRARSCLEKLRARIPKAHRPGFEEAHTRGLHTPPATTHQTARDDALRDLLRINRELTREHHPERVLHMIVDCAVELTGGERGFVLLASPSGRVNVEVARNIDQESIKRSAFKVSRSVAEQVLASGDPVLTSDALEDERFRSTLSVHEMNLRSILCVPLRMRERTIGALYLDNRWRRGAFQARHVELLQAFADQAAIALHNAELLHDAEIRNAELAATKAEVERLNVSLQETVSAQANQIEEMTVRLGSEQEELVRRYSASNLVGRGKRMCEIFRLIDRIADKDVAVLIQGETGTGKELVAKAIHFNSARRAGPFVSINCAAIPPTLLESELFGHTRGAFTGAVRDKPGLFETARRGTLLLDEVGDMPMEMQAKLLRVLQEGRVRRIGEEDERSIDARVVSASLHDLRQMVASGRFRDDLFFRLNVVQINLPPLRERTEDIPQLVLHLLRQIDPGATVSQRALELLLRHSWPGNVRELQNELLRAVALGPGEVVAESLSDRLLNDAPLHSGDQGLAVCLSAAERTAILHALDRADGSVTRAAELLGISRVVLHRKLHKHALSRQERQRARPVRP